MSKRANYSATPPELILEQRNEKIIITVTANVSKEVREDGTESWNADVNKFWEHTDLIDVETLKANPASYIDYLPVRFKEAGRKEAQRILDEHRAGKHCMPVIPVPFIKENGYVCNRPEDQTKLAAVLAAGVGLEYYELADNSIVSLTPDQVKQVFLAGMQVETEMQKAKQQCWALIDSASSEEDITAALENFRSNLHPYGI